MSHMKPLPLLYDVSAPASTAAQKDDARWLAKNRSSLVRVRLLSPGESPLADLLTAQDSNDRAYAVVINHAGVRDKRARLGIAVYPLPIFSQDEKTAEAIVGREAKKMAKHFRKSASSPPPRQGVGLVAGGSHDD